METAALAQWSILIAGALAVSAGILISVRRLFFCGLAAIALTMAAPFIQDFALRTLGVGVSIPIACLALASLSVWAMRVGARFHRRLFWPGGAWIILANLACYASILESQETLLSTKSSAGLSIATLSGWVLIGSVSTADSRPRITTGSIVDGIGIVSTIASCLALVVLGPMCMEGGVGGDNNQVRVFGFELSRLGMVGFNATGVSVTASTSVIYLLLSFPRIRSRTLKVAALVFGMISLAALVWSGSRGPMIALGLTLLLVRAIFSLNRKNVIMHWKVDLVLAAILCALAWQVLANFFRVQIGDSPSSSLFTTFVISRVPESALEQVINPTPFGIGYNSLSASASRENTDIESYFLKALVELGYVGSVVYCLAFAALSWTTLRADFVFVRAGDRLGFLPSAMLIFVYANSPSSWGFIYPYGNLFLMVGLMSSSAVALAQYEGRSAMRSRKEHLSACL